MTKTKCADLIIEMLSIPEKPPSLSKSIANSTIVNTTRGIHSVTLLQMVWDPTIAASNAEQRRLRGGSNSASSSSSITISAAANTSIGAKQEVISYARSKVAHAPTDDDELIGLLCDSSSYFFSLWMLLNVEMRLAVEPFVEWAAGNFEPYVRLFPPMTMLVASVNKPKVQRAFLIKLHCLALYAAEHPDILVTMGENCRKLVETTIEYHHSRLRRYVDSNVPNLTHHQYLEGSTICFQVDKMKHEVTDWLTNMKPKETERIHSLVKSEKAAFLETRTATRKFLATPFKEMVDMLVDSDGKITQQCTGKYEDKHWPRSDNLGFGQARLEDEGLPLLQKYLENCHATPDAAPTDLRSFMKSRFARVEDLKIECKRRGVSTVGNKGVLADRVTDHAESHPNGFKSRDRSTNASVALDTDLASNPVCFVAAMAALNDDDDDDDGGGGVDTDDGGAGDDDDDDEGMGGGGEGEL